jgi:hypothetical protein
MRRGYDQPNTTHHDSSGHADRISIFHLSLSLRAALTITCDCSALGAMAGLH